MHACLAAHPLHPMPSQARISLFTNLPLRSERPYFEAMTFTQSTVHVHSCLYSHLPVSRELSPQSVCIHVYGLAFTN